MAEKDRGRECPSKMADRRPPATLNHEGFWLDTDRLECSEWDSIANSYPTRLYESTLSGGVGPKPCSLHTEPRPSSTLREFPLWFRAPDKRWHPW